MNSPVLVEGEGSTVGIAVGEAVGVGVDVGVGVGVEVSGGVGVAAALTSTFMVLLADAATLASLFETVVPTMFH